MSYAIIDNANKVVNVIEWDGSAEWQPPHDHQAVPLIQGGIGWSYIDGQFAPPAPPEEVTP
jgi:hypothetical protein